MAQYEFNLTSFRFVFPVRSHLLIICQNVIQGLQAQLTLSQNGVSFFCRIWRGGGELASIGASDTLERMRKTAF